MKLRVVQEEVSARLGPSQGRLQEDVVPDTETGHYTSRIIPPVGSFVWGLWDLLLHAPFPTPRNRGIIRAFLWHICTFNTGEYYIITCNMYNVHCYMWGSFLQHSFSLTEEFFGFIFILPSNTRWARQNREMSILEEGPQVDEERVRVSDGRTGSCGCAERKGEAPERTVYHNSAMSNGSTRLPARACDPFNFLEEEKAFPHHRLTSL